MVKARVRVVAEGDGASWGVLRIAFASLRMIGWRHGVPFRGIDSVDALGTLAMRCRISIRNGRTTGGTGMSAALGQPAAWEGGGSAVAAAGLMHMVMMSLMSLMRLILDVIQPLTGLALVVGVVMSIATLQLRNPLLQGLDIFALNMRARCRLGRQTLIARLDTI